MKSNKKQNTISVTDIISIKEDQKSENKALNNDNNNNEI